MTTTFQTPNLSRIGQKAFTDALNVFLSLTATSANLSQQGALSTDDQITSTIPLAGQRLSGRVQIRLPRAFLGHTIRRLIGRDANVEIKTLLDDAAGELANMVAGRVAAHLTGEGCSCSLGTPSSPGLFLETGDRAQINLVCEGYLLSLEIQCRYSHP